MVHKGYIMITVFGIKSCDTCRKALTWLGNESLEHRFHEFRADGLETARLEAWIATCGWEALLNRRSTTWRQLTASDTSDLNEAKALGLMASNPTLIKRPVFEYGTGVAVGFNDTVKNTLKGAAR